MPHLNSFLQKEKKSENFRKFLGLAGNPEHRPSFFQAWLLRKSFTERRKKERKHLLHSVKLGRMMNVITREETKGPWGLSLNSLCLRYIQDI